MTDKRAPAGNGGSSLFMIKLINAAVSQGESLSRANAGFAGVQTTFEIRPPMSTASSKVSAKITAVLRGASPLRSWPARSPLSSGKRIIRVLLRGAIPFRSWPPRRPLSSYKRRPNEVHVQIRFLIPSQILFATIGLFIV